MKFLADQGQSKWASPYAPQVSGSVELFLHKLSHRENYSALHFLSQAQRQNSLKNCLSKGFTIFLFISFEIKAHEEISLARQIVQLWNSLPQTFMEAEITVYRHSSKGIRYTQD